MGRLSVTINGDHALSTGREIPSFVEGPQLDTSFTSALDYLFSAAIAYHDRPAVVSMFQPSDLYSGILSPSLTLPPKDSAQDYLRWNYGQLKHASELFASALTAHGVREGMTIASFIPGCVEFYISLYAALLLKSYWTRISPYSASPSRTFLVLVKGEQLISSARCTFCPMNPRSVANQDEIRHMMRVAGTQVVIASNEEFVLQLEQSVPDFQETVKLALVLESGSNTCSAMSLVKTFGEVLLSGLRNGTGHDEKLIDFVPQLPAVTHKLDDIAMIIFTSGTTSLPKACALTNSNVLGGLTNYTDWMGIRGTAVTSNHLPMYHVSGVYAGLGMLGRGAKVVHPALAFSPKSLLKAISLERISHLVLVPVMIGLLLNDPGLKQTDTTSLSDIILGASTILPTDVLNCYNHIMSPASPAERRVAISYGMTETLGIATRIVPRSDVGTVIDGIMYILPGKKVRLCKPDSMELVSRGEPGEVHVSGLGTISGYISGNNEVFYDDEDGHWIKTGDQAIMNKDGGFQITGRYKDMIIRGGVNISPMKIEGIIARITGIEAHVVGMPDVVAGEVPVAVIRTADAGEAKVSTLREPIVRELGPHCAIERFMGLEELGLKDFPRTASGKVRKVELQALLKNYAARRASESQNGRGAKSTLQALTAIWSDLAGFAQDELTPQTSVHDMADSLMLARYANTVRQQLSKALSLQDLEEYRTLEDQARFLDSQSLEANEVALPKPREGAVGLEDMAHAAGDESLASRTKQLCEQTLKPMGLSWADVQDVVTPSEYHQSWTKPRPTSDRLRFCYLTSSIDVEAAVSALEETLKRHDALRSVSVKLGHPANVHAILRPTKQWFENCITTSSTLVETPKELNTLLPPDFELRHGMLMHAAVAQVKQTNSAGLCIMFVHSATDMFSLELFVKDFNACLQNTQVQIPQRVPYKLWADHLYNGSFSAKARDSIAFTVKRLSGISGNAATLWPPQRSPVWQRGCDRGLCITPEGAVTTADDPNKRKLLDGPAEACTGSSGVTRACTLVDMASLSTTHRVNAYIIIKASLSLLMARKTGQQSVVFSQTFAMRDVWPFVDDWVSERLPSPLEVTGPCLARVIDRIGVDPNQEVLAWLKQLKHDQNTLIKHAHAPYRQVYEALNKRALHGKHKDVATTNGSVYHGGDGDFLEDVRRRINLNWLPNITTPKAASSSGATMGPVGPAPKEIHMIEGTHFNEQGIAIHCGLQQDGKTCWVRIVWDDGNVRASEATEWCEEIVRIAELLGRAETWHKTVGSLSETV